MKILNILTVKTEKRKTGDLGEDAAAKFLRKQGYKILARNYVAAGHEIDVVATDKKVTAFVEVKTRTVGHTDPKEPRPASAVTPEKQRGIISAAKYYQLSNQIKTPMRFDVIEVYLSEENGKKAVSEVRHLQGAFNGDTAYKR